MFQYEKALQYPVKIARPNARLAKMIMSQLGGLNAKKIQPAEDHSHAGLLLLGECCLGRRAARSVCCVSGW